jgi:hypothetical protein
MHFDGFLSILWTLMIVGATIFFLIQTFSG